MKQLLFICALLFSFCASAQTALDSNNVTFNVKLATALQVRQLVPITEIQVAIASATQGVTDTAATVPVTITEAQLVQVYRTLSDVSINLARPINDELELTLQPLAMTNSRIAAAIFGIDAGYKQRRAALFLQGKSGNAALQKAISNN